MVTNVPPSLIPLLAGEQSPQHPFPWRREPWSAQMHDLPEVLATLDQLPDKVDRQSIRRVVLSELEAGRVLSAFVAVMVWGWGTTSGQGALRTRWILTQIDDKSQAPAAISVVSSVSDRLRSGAETARYSGPLEAFRVMNNEGAIKHLGRSYFTKWLYFASAMDGPDDPAAAPVLDDKVANWLRDEAHVFLDKTTASYAKYLELLGEWGNMHGRTRVQVEKAIFHCETGRG